MLRNCKLGLIWQILLMYVHSNLCPSEHQTIIADNTPLWAHLQRRLTIVAGGMVGQDFHHPVVARYIHSTVRSPKQKHQIWSQTWSQLVFEDTLESASDDVRRANQERSRTLFIFLVVAISHFLSQQSCALTLYRAIVSVCPNEKRKRCLSGMYLLVYRLVLAQTP